MLLFAVECEPAFVSKADLFSLKPKVDFGCSQVVQGMEERKKAGGRLGTRKAMIELLFFFFFCQK